MMFRHEAIKGISFALVAFALFFFSPPLSRAAYAQEWELLAAECGRLLGSQEGVKAKELAVKCLALATTETQTCRSLLLNAQACLCSNDLDEASDYAQRAFHQAVIACRFTDFYDRLPEVVEELQRLKRNDREEASMKEIEARRWAARKKVEETFGRFEEELSEPILLTQQQAIVWLLMPDIVKIRGAIALAAGQPTDAEIFFRQGMVLGEHLFGRESKELAELCRDLGRAYALSGRDVLAVPLLEEAVRVLQKHYRTASLAEAQSLLAASLEKTGDATRAASLRKELEAANTHFNPVFVIAGVCVAVVSAWAWRRIASRSSLTEPPNKSQTVKVSLVREPPRLTYQSGTPASDGKEG